MSGGMRINVVNLDDGEQDVLSFSEQKSPQQLLEENPLGMDNYMYPLDIGTDGGVYKHILRIYIYRQIKSGDAFRNVGLVSGNSYDFGRGAGASKVQSLDTAAGTLAAGAVGVAGSAASTAGQILTQNPAIAPRVAPYAAAAAAALSLAGKTFGGLNVDTDITRKTQKQAAAYISLYMPETLQVTDRQDFDAVSFTESLGSVGIANALMSDPMHGELAGQAAEASGIFGKGINDIAVFSNGYALNPLLEVLYKGSKNREFVFQFKFVPRSPEETDQILGIIRTLRYHAAPEYDASGSNSRYFIPPSEFGIEFFIGNRRNTNIPRIGQCVLTNVDVNYAPSGQYSTYIDGMPTEISMQLTFTETVILTKEDIKIGY